MNALNINSSHSPTTFLQPANLTTYTYTIWSLFNLQYPLLICCHLIVCFGFFFIFLWLRVLDYSTFESTLNSSIVSYRIARVFVESGINVVRCSAHVTRYNSTTECVLVKHMDNSGRDSGDGLTNVQPVTFYFMSLSSLRPHYSHFT